MAGHDSDPQAKALMEPVFELSLALLAIVTSQIV